MGQLDERDTRVFESARTRRTRTLRINSSRHPSEKHCSPSREILAQHLALEARLIRKRYKIAVGEHRDATPVPSVSRLWIRRSARFTACWTPPGRLPRRTPTQPKHTHSLHARGHTSNRPRLAWESFRYQLPLVALLLDAVRRLPRSWPDHGATESDGTGQWESNRDAGEPGAGPSDGIDTLPPKDSDGTSFMIFIPKIVHIQMLDYIYGRPIYRQNGCKLIC